MKNSVSFKKCILAFLIFAPLMQEAWASNTRSEVNRRIKQLNAEIDKIGGLIFPPIWAALIAEIPWLVSEVVNLIELSDRFKSLDKKLNREREKLVSLEK